MKKICVDRGHGWSNRIPLVFDPGACGLVREADITFILASLINIKFKYDGYETLPIRIGGFTTGISLNSGIKKANAQECDAYISVHMNSDVAGKGTGWEIWCSKDNVMSRALSAYIFEELDGVIKQQMQFRGVKETGSLAVCVKTKMPTCLIELGFVHSQKDVDLVKHKENFLNLCARAIVNGTKNFLTKPNK